MHKTVIALGFVILIIGLVIAFSNSIAIDKPGHFEDAQGNNYGDQIPSNLFDKTHWVPGIHTVIYPYLIAGGIVSLIGFVTSVIGYYMKTKETEQ